MDNSLPIPTHAVTATSVYVIHSSVKNIYTETLKGYFRDYFPLSIRSTGGMYVYV